MMPNALKIRLPATANTGEENAAGQRGAARHQLAFQVMRASIRGHQTYQDGERVTWKQDGRPRRNGPVLVSGRHGIVRRKQTPATPK